MSRSELLPILKEAFLECVSRHTWLVLRSHWEGNPRAFQELQRQTPDGCEAVASFLAREFARRLPEAGTDEARLSEAIQLFSLRACQETVADEEFRSYLQWRADQPGLMDFLQRVAQNYSAKETPEIGTRLAFGIYWDLFIIPLRFWTDAASAELLTCSGAAFNLDKVRNTRRELGLRRARPCIVKRFQRWPGSTPRSPGRIEIQLDAAAAARLRLPRMLEAFVRFCGPYR